MRKDKTERMTYITILLLLVLCGSFLPGEEGKDLMDDLYAAIKNQDQPAAEEISQKLMSMGDSAMPLLEKGLAIKNKPLQSRILKILNHTKTASSTKIVLGFAACEKDKYMVRAAIETLRYPERDIDVEVDEKILNFLLEKVHEGELMFAPDAARILGKMKTVSPKIRAAACIAALKKEVLRQSDPNTSHKLLPNSYGTEPQFKIRQYIYALQDVGTPAIPFISTALGTISDSNFKQYLTICSGFVGDKNSFTALEKILTGSKDGEARALAAMALGRLSNENAIPALKKALEDAFFISYQSGGRMKEIFPVREAGASSLQKLGVKIKREGNKFTVEE